MAPGWHSLASKPRAWSWPWMVRGSGSLTGPVAADGWAVRPELREISGCQRRSVGGLDDCRTGGGGCVVCESDEPVDPGRVGPQVGAQQWVDAAVGEDV